MPKHLGILELKYFSGGEALLDDMDTKTSTSVIKTSSLAYGA